MDGGESLRRLRERRGWSWTDLAGVMRATATRIGLTHLDAVRTASIRRNVARWEAFGASVPDHRNQLVLAHAFACDGFGRLQVGAGSDLAELLDAFGRAGVEPAQLADLRVAVIRAAATDRWPGGSLGIEDLAVAFGQISNDVGTIPFARSQSAIAPIISGFGRLVDNVSGPDYHRLGAGVFALAGRLSFELHDDASTANYYARAISHARRQPDGWLTATTLTSIAIITMHRDGDLDAAERLATEAARLASGGSSPAAVARTLALQAEISARRGMARPAQDTIEIAAAEMASAGVDDPASSRMNEARLDGFLGLCDLLTGRPETSIEPLRRAVIAMSQEPSQVVQRCIVQADLAAGLLANPVPEPVHAAAELAACATTLKDIRGRVAANRIRQVRRDLRPWAAESFVIELDEFLWSVLT